MWSGTQIHIACSTYVYIVYIYRPIYIYSYIYNTRAQIYVMLMSKAAICSLNCSIYWKFLGKYSKDMLKFAFTFGSEKKQQREKKENNIHVDFLYPEGI